MDQIQYTERMRELMDILAPKLREEDLSHIWELVDRAASPQVVDNIHGILTVAARKFSPMQFEHILQLVCKVSVYLSMYVYVAYLPTVCKVSLPPRQAFSCVNCLPEC